MTSVRPVVLAERWAIGTTLTLIVATLALVWWDPTPRLAVAGLAAALIGAGAAPLLYRAYRQTMLRPVPEEPHDRRFLRATRSVLTWTSVVGAVGLAGYLLSGQWIALLGVATHTLIAGAIWPTDARRAAFTETEQAP